MATLPRARLPQGKGFTVTGGRLRMEQRGDKQVGESNVGQKDETGKLNLLQIRV